jgi:hypothetical protein
MSWQRLRRHPFSSAVARPGARCHLACVVVAIVAAGCTVGDSGEERVQQRTPAGKAVRADGSADRLGLVEGGALNLAQRFQPTVVVDDRDGFWPVSVRVPFRPTYDHGGPRCVRRWHDNQLRASGGCFATPANLPWSNRHDARWSIDFPPKNTTKAHETALLRALDLSRESGDMTDKDRKRTSQLYFLSTPGPSNAVSLQYWLYYTFNYQPLASSPNSGMHEGDFESIGMVLSRDRKPVWVWMARHDQEGNRFTWDDPALEREPGDPEHLRVHAARGSHATYESCGRKNRVEHKVGTPDDRASCSESATTRFRWRGTRLVDLARTNWACWRGRYGYSPNVPKSKEVKRLRHPNGPRLPLWQQAFPEPARPCDTVEEPHQLEVLGEGSGDELTAAKLRTAAGRVSGLFTSCLAWDQRPAVGAYVAVCSDELLQRFAQAGLVADGEVKATCLRLNRERGECPARPLLPLSRRDTSARRLSGLRIYADRPATVRVYVHERRGRKDRVWIFDRVAISPRSSLELHRSWAPSIRLGWRLIDSATHEHLEASEDFGYRVPQAPPAPRRINTHRDGDQVLVSFVGSRGKGLAYGIAAVDEESDQAPLALLSFRSTDPTYFASDRESEEGRFVIRLLAPGARFIDITAWRHGRQRSVRCPAHLSPPDTCVTGLGPGPTRR